MEKVVKGLECCASSGNMCKEKCPYNELGSCWDECVRPLTIDALTLLKEQEERIAIMRESMEAMERRLAAAEGKLIEAKSIDQMAYIGWMYEGQKLRLSEDEFDSIL